MTTEGDRATDEALISGIGEERIRAIRAESVGVLTRGHAPNVLTFDALNPLRYAGSEAVGERAARGRSRHRCPVGYEVREALVPRRARKRGA